jgi:hypothetical protein
VSVPLLWRDFVASGFALEGVEFDAIVLVQGRTDQEDRGGETGQSTDHLLVHLALDLVPHLHHRK